MNRIILIVEGGNIVETLSNTTIELIIVDYDQKKVGENYIFNQVSDRMENNEFEKELKKITQ